MATPKTKLLVILGPTASGKSALGVELAKKFDGEIISADSRQVYRGLDIGTGKITKRQMHGIRHHLLDIASARRPFTAGEFAKKARVAASIISNSGRLPIVVGGTGFYIDAFVDRISLPEVAPDQKLRKRLANKSAAQLYAILCKRDPKRARAMASLSERNNKVRLIRALEIAAAKDGPRVSVAPRYDTLWVGISRKDTDLNHRIAIRLFARIRDGMVQEARRLHAGGLSYKRMEELGLEYRSLARYLQKKTTKEEMIEELARDIRRYAKKQLAYWKRNPDVTWFKPTQQVQIEKAIRVWLRK